jgi:hypothetical protein
MTENRPTDVPEWVEALEDAELRDLARDAFVARERATRMGAPRHGLASADRHLAAIAQGRAVGAPARYRAAAAVRRYEKLAARMERRRQRA